MTCIRDIGNVFSCRWGLLDLTNFYLEIWGQLYLVKCTLGVRNYWQLVKPDKVKLCSFLRVTDNITSGNIQVCFVHACIGPSVNRFVPV